MPPDFSIISTAETMFFSKIPGSKELGQWILMRIHSLENTPVKGIVTITAKGEEVETRLDIQPGVHQYRGYASMLWPDGTGISDALLTLEIKGQTISTTVSVSHYRPWVIYLLSDTCSDYTWAYKTENGFIADDIATTEAELEATDATMTQPTESQNRYSFVHTREVEFYLDTHSSKESQKLFDRVRSGHLSINPIYNQSLSGLQSLEEMIRQFYPARQWERAYNIPIKYANHQETPTISWGMASILANSNIYYLVKSPLPFQCPWLERLREPPIFLWEGPDGSRILVRRCNHGYSEGNFVLRDVSKINQVLHRLIIPKYEALEKQYPFNLIGVVGCYGDLSADTKNMAAIKSMNIAAYNNQGWEYPKLVNASHQEFWKAVDAQISKGAKMSVFRGDYGTGWEVWTLSLAHYLASWRRAQERATTADYIVLIASRLDISWYNSHRENLKRAWNSLISLADHAWNGSDDENRSLNFSLRKRWSEEANKGFDKVITSGLNVIASQVSADRETILVFNSLGWERTGIARVEVGEETPVVIKEKASGKTLPTQINKKDDKIVVYFEARDIPSVGYRTYYVEPEIPTANGSVVVHENGIENDFYRIKINWTTGGIESLYSKKLGKELIDSTSQYQLNQWVYNLLGTDYIADTVSISAGSNGPVFGEIIVTTQASSIKVKTILRLYSNLDRIDIRNEVEKSPTVEREKLHFFFPVDIPDRNYRFEAPGAIIKAGEISRGGEQLPGSGQAYTAAQNFVDVSNESYGVTISQVDSSIIQFGHRTEKEDPEYPNPSNSTVISFALGNTIGYPEVTRNPADGTVTSFNTVDYGEVARDYYKEVTRDQGGVTHFVFRYSLRAHNGYNPEETVRFAWERTKGLLSVTVPSPSSGILPQDQHSFVNVVSEEKVILTNCKIPEENPGKGAIIRLWNLGEKDSPVQVNASDMWKISSAERTDMLERTQESLKFANNAAELEVRARGFATVLMKE